VYSITNTGPMVFVGTAFSGSFYKHSHTIQLTLLFLNNTKFTNNKTKARSM